VSAAIDTLQAVVGQLTGSDAGLRGGTPGPSANAAASPPAFASMGLFRIPGPPPQQELQQELQPPPQQEQQQELPQQLEQQQEQPQQQHPGSQQQQDAEQDASWSQLRHEAGVNVDAAHQLRQALQDALANLQDATRPGAVPRPGGDDLAQLIEETQAELDTVNNEIATLHSTFDALDQRRRRAGGGSQVGYTHEVQIGIDAATPMSSALQGQGQGQEHVRGEGQSRQPPSMTRRRPLRRHPEAPASMATSAGREAAPAATAADSGLADGGGGGGGGEATARTANRLTGTNNNQRQPPDQGASRGRSTMSYGSGNTAHQMSFLHAMGIQPPGDGGPITMADLISQAPGFDPAAESTGILASFMENVLTQVPLDRMAALARGTFVRLSSVKWQCIAPYPTLPPMRPICVYRRRLSLMAVVTERIHGHCTDHNFIVHGGRRAGGSHRAAAALCSVCRGAFPRNRRPVSAGTQRTLLYLPLCILHSATRV